MSTIAARSPMRLKAIPEGDDWLGPEAACLRHVLFASDLRYASEGAFEHARFLAERFHARLTLLHLVDARRYAGPRTQERVARATDDARRYLDVLADGLAVRHQTVVDCTGNPGAALARHLHVAQPDLTVMATHGRKGISHLVLGSVTETVLRHSGRPTLCVREPAHGSPYPYRCIVVATDLSSPSRRAFPLAALLARAFGAEVLVVHTAPHSKGGPDEGDVYAAVYPDLPGVRLAICIPDGPAEAAILGLAARERADLIVMAGHAPESLRQAIAGGPAERIVRHSPCPVLVV